MILFYTAFLVTSNRQAKSIYSYTFIIKSFATHKFIIVLNTHISHGVYGV